MAIHTYFCPKSNFLEISCLIFVVMKMKTEKMFFTNMVNKGIPHVLLAL